MKLVKTKYQPKNGINIMLKDTRLLYAVTRAGGVPAYGKTSEDGLEDHQWKVTCEVTKEVGKELQKHHKTLKPKKFTGKEFVEKFETPPLEVNDKDSYFTVTFKKSCAYLGRDGSVQPKSLTVLTKTPGEDMTGVMIGNQSIGNVLIHIGKYDNQFGSGTSMRLEKLQVTTLVEYIP